MSKRVVLTCWGSYGDLFPYLAIALRLKAMGHRPLVVTIAFHREMVERHGLEFHPMRPDVDPSDTDLIARIMHPARGPEVLIRELVVPAVRDALSDVCDAIRGVDLVISHPVAFAVPIAADALKVPWLSTVLAPTSLFSVHDFPVLPPSPMAMTLARTSPWIARVFMAIIRRVTSSWTMPVRGLRREVGLADTGSPLLEGQFSPRGTLALFSPVFGPPQVDWPVNTTATGFVFHDDGAPMAADVERFMAAGPPPIVFTLGSSATNAAGRFYEESVNAATAVGKRALLLVGRDPRNRPATTWPDTVCAAEYAPHAQVFPRAAAVVHHGGVGTTGQALRAGRPMLVVPHSHDQPDNAFRCRRLGVARTIDARFYTARRVAPLLRAICDDPGYAARAHAIGMQVQREDGVGLACATISRALGAPAPDDRQGAWAR